MRLCQRCHAAAGDGRGPIQPNLAGFPRAFLNNQDYFRNISNDRIIKSIEKGIPGTSMPPYEKVLNRSQSKMMVNLVFDAFIGIRPDDKIDVPPLPPRPDKALSLASSLRLFKENCSRCHGITGNGKGPEYLDYLPRPRNLTNHYYFAEHNDEQLARAMANGIPGTAMPPFRNKISDEQLWGLVDLARAFSGTDQ